MPLLLLGPLARILVPILGAILLFSVGYVKGRMNGMDSVQVAWDKERAQMLVEQALRQADARQKEAELQDRADKIREEKSREIADLNRRHAAALERMRNRPDRPAPAAGGMSTAAGHRDGAGGCTPSELYRPDAELALEIARRADSVRVQLAACQAAYKSAFDRQ